MDSLLDGEKVEAMFIDWVDMLVVNHGDKTVADVLSSPAILSCFIGDIGQFARTAPLCLKDHPRVSDGLTGESCPKCGEAEAFAPGGGVVCSKKCGWWFCY